MSTRFRTVLVVAVSATFGLLAFVWFLGAVS